MFKDYPLNGLRTKMLDLTPSCQDQVLLETTKCPINILGSNYKVYFEQNIAIQREQVGTVRWKMVDLSF